MPSVHRSQGLAKELTELIGVPISGVFIQLRQVLFLPGFLPSRVYRQLSISPEWITGLGLQSSVTKMGSIFSGRLRRTSGRNNGLA